MCVLQVYFHKSSYFFLVEYGFDFDVDRIERHIRDPIQYAFKNELPIIIWWTPFTGDMGSVKRCKEGSCLVSQDRSLFGHKLNQVMVFYGTDFNESDLPIPRRGILFYLINGDNRS